MGVLDMFLPKWLGLKNRTLGMDYLDNFITDLKMS